MDFENVLPGPIWGKVTKNDDPEALGRVKVFLPGLFEPETPFWVLPVGWPGAGGIGQGSQYQAPPVGAQVLVTFVMGIYQGPDVQAVYQTGYYGVGSDGLSAGPSQIKAASTPAKARQRTVVWEDEYVAITVVAEDDDRRVLIQGKKRGSKIELDAKAGENGTSEVITIEAATALSLYCKGQIDIFSDTLVTIQGRNVSNMAVSDI